MVGNTGDRSIDRECSAFSSLPYSTVPPVDGRGVDIAETSEPPDRVTPVAWLCLAWLWIASGSE